MTMFFVCLLGLGYFAGHDERWYWYLLNIQYPAYKI